jgi:predicted phage tail protein
MSFRYPKGGFISSFYDPLQVPNAPTSVSASGGDAQATVTFTAPANVGGSAITGYVAQSVPEGISATGSASPITVTGLTNGTAYTINVAAINSYGPGPYGTSGSVTPDVLRRVCLLVDTTTIWQLHTTLLIT